MASNQTPNFGLSQWEADDPVLRADFNADNQRIEAEFERIASEMRFKGDCSINRNGYLGTGTCGADHTCRVGLSFFPSFIVIADRETGIFMIWTEGAKKSLSPWYPNSPIIPSRYTLPNGDGTRSQYFEWYSDTPEHQFNLEGHYYDLMAFRLTQ